MARTFTDKSFLYLGRWGSSELKGRKISYIAVVVALTVLALLVGCRLMEYILYPRRYSEYVSRYSTEYGVEEYVVYSVIRAESGFDRNAVSPKGACGLMQLMPDTYAWLTELRREEGGDIFDPDENIKYGVYYLSLLYGKYGNWAHALCAYNAGMGNVDRWLSKKPFEIPFPETKEYVNKLEVPMGKYKRLYYE